MRFSWTAFRGFFPDPDGPWVRTLADGGRAGTIVVFVPYDTV